MFNEGFGDEKVQETETGRGSRLRDSLKGLKDRIRGEAAPSTPRGVEHSPIAMKSASELIPTDAARALERALSQALGKIPEETATQIRGRVATEVAHQKSLLEKGTRTPEQVDTALSTASRLFEAITRGKTTPLGARAANDPQMRAEGGYYPPRDVSEGVDLFYATLGAKRPDVHQAQRANQGESVTMHTETPLGTITESLAVSTPPKSTYDTLGIKPVTNGGERTIPAELHTIYTHDASGS